MSDARDMLVNAGTESLALSLTDGHVDASVAGAMASIVRAESGRVVGFVRSPPSTAFVDLDGRERWSTDAFPYANAASALAVGDLVVIAANHTFTAGASLAAFELSSGAMRWTGQVQTLAIAHNAYSSDVELRLDQGILVLRGTESMQDYLELFYSASGRRVLSAVAYR